MANDAGNRKIILRRRPSGLLAPDDLKWVTETVPAANDGEAIVKTAMLAMDPVSRLMLGADIGIMPPIPLGAAIRGFGAGHVVASRCPELPVGSRVTGFFEWADYQRLRPGTHTHLLPDPVGYIQALNLHGHTAHAAYFGMIEVGAVAAGETVMVTGAAGAVGSIAAQIARIQGARVVGLAGTAEKCAWLRSDLRLDAAINYRDDDVDAALRTVAPQGINLVFDNVGGPLLNTLIGHLVPGARVVLCGATSQYLNENPFALAYDPRLLEARNATAKRFNAMDYARHFASAFAQMAQWEKEGRLHVAREVVTGLEQAPAALNRLFEGTSRGRLLVELGGVD
jgi:NADPH-dependent curcumin reductase CurA